jgi:four helix bundle protein
MSNEKKSYIALKDLIVYQIARELSKIGWSIYSNMSFEGKKLMGDQFIRSIDSVGANIAEGYGRFHYLDKNRFYYNARASSFEAVDHWAELLFERNYIKNEVLLDLQNKGKTLQVKLNNMISSTLKAGKKV